MSEVVDKTSDDKSSDNNVNIDLSDNSSSDTIQKNKEEFNGGVKSGSKRVSLALSTMGKVGEKGSGREDSRSATAADMVEIYGKETSDNIDDRRDSDWSNYMTENPIRAPRLSRKSVLQARNIGGERLSQHEGSNRSNHGYHKSITGDDQGMRSAGMVISQLCRDLRHGKFFRSCYTITSWHIYWVVYSLIIWIEPF